MAASPTDMLSHIFTGLAAVLLPLQQISPKKRSKFIYRFSNIIIAIFAWTPIIYFSILIIYTIIIISRINTTSSAGGLRLFQSCTSSARAYSCSSVISAPFVTIRCVSIISLYCYSCFSNSIVRGAPEAPLIPMISLFLIFLPFLTFPFILKYV